MTENEVKTKWCPMSRITIFPHVDDRISLSSNRDISLLVPPNSYDPATDITKCLASDCMMWRWTAERGRYAETGAEVPISGYCGLGGKP